MSGFRGKKVDPSKNSNGRPVGTGSPNHSHAAVIAPPELAEGQKRCPACRNAVGIRLDGSLRGHADLFGDRCWNRLAPDREAIEYVVPPVDLTRSSTNTTPPDGRCQECAKAIPPMRRLCGRCNARRH